MGLLNTFGVAPASPEPTQAPTPRASATRAPMPTTPSIRPNSTPSRSPKPGQSGKRGSTKRGRGRKISGPAAPLQDRRRRLVAARDVTLRDLGGLMLEMYKRNRFREELLLDKCEEVLAIEVEVAHIDQRLFQLASPSQSGQRPIGRCDCSAPLMPGQNFCASCGRSLGTLTQTRPCSRCGTALRPGDAYCASCGTESPDVLESLAAPTAPGSGRASAASAAARSVVHEAPPLIEEPSAPEVPLAPTTVIELPTSHAPAPMAPVTAPEASVQAALSVLPTPPDASSATPVFPTELPTPSAPTPPLSPRDAAKVQAKEQRDRQRRAKARAKERMREARTRPKGGNQQ